MSLFRTENDGLTFRIVLILLGLPLLLSGQYLLGGASILLVLAIRISECTEKSDTFVPRFDLLSPENILSELQRIVEVSDRNNEVWKTRASDEEIRIKCIVEGLSVLGRKYNVSNHKEDLSLLYQHLVFQLIGLYPQNHEIISGSMSLLALIAKDTRVRARFKRHAEDYGLKRAINVLKKVLQQAKKEVDEGEEAALAEILRKGCLFLGAICNDSKDLELQCIIVSEGGLSLILEIANWFRLHEEIAKWSLWATFILTYNNLPIKAELIRLQGIQTICRLMETNPKSLEVNRHGTALLFDLMRDNYEEDEIPWNPWEIRKLAILSGLHNRIVHNLNEFSDKEIFLMGREILIGTDYRGNIPAYNHF